MKTRADILREAAGRGPLARLDVRTPVVFSRTCRRRSGMGAGMGLEPEFLRAPIAEAMERPLMVAHGSSAGSSCSSSALIELLMPVSGTVVMLTVGEEGPAVVQAIRSPWVVRWSGCVEMRREALVHSYLMRYARVDEAGMFALPEAGSGVQFLKPANWGFNPRASRQHAKRTEFDSTANRLIDQLRQVVRWVGEIETRLEHCGGHQYRNVALELLEVRNAAQESYVSLDDAYVTARVEGHPGAGAMGRRLNQVGRMIELFDGRLEKQIPLLRLAASTFLLENWRRLLAPARQELLPWWLDGCLETGE